MKIFKGFDKQLRAEAYQDSPFMHTEAWGRF